MLPAAGEQPKFAEIYMMGDDVQAARRNEIFENVLNHDTIESLQRMFREIGNPFVEIFKQAREIPGANHSIRLIANSNVDQRRYNLPTVDEVAVLIPDGEDIDAHRDIILRYQEGGRLKRITEMHKSYDALQYPILLSYGENGWHENLRYVVRGREQGRKKVTELNWASWQIQKRQGRQRILHLKSD